MTQTLRMRIPPANIDRPSNGAIQNSGLPATRPARFVLEATTPRPMERKALARLINRLQAQNPAHARAGFLLFPARISVIGRLSEPFRAASWRT
jgi:hypothetical protein